MNKALPDKGQAMATTALLLLSGVAPLARGQGDWRITLPAFLIAALIYGILFNCRLDLLQAPAFCRSVLAVYLLLLNGWLLGYTTDLLLTWWESAPPRWILLLFISLLYSYGAWRGAAALLRLSMLIAALLLVWAVVDSVLLWRQYEAARLVMAGLDGDWLGRGGAELLILLAPAPALLLYLRSGEDGRGGGAVWGLAIAGAYLLLLRLRDQAVLGGLAALSPYPLLRTLSMASAGMGLNRVEYFGLLALLAAALLAGMLMLGAVFDLTGRKGKPALMAAQFIAAMAFVYELF